MRTAHGKANDEVMVRAGPIRGTAGLPRAEPIRSAKTPGSFSFRQARTEFRLPRLFQFSKLQTISGFRALYRLNFWAISIEGNVANLWNLDLLQRCAVIPHTPNKFLNPHLLREGPLPLSMMSLRVGVVEACEGCCRLFAQSFPFPEFPRRGSWLRIM